MDNSKPRAPLCVYLYFLLFAVTLTQNLEARVCTIFGCCGGNGDLSCAGICDPGYAPDAALYCRPCGGNGEATCYGVCDPGFAPDAGLICRPCGGAGEGTCYGVCDPGLIPNINLICIPCGGNGEPTCLGICESGYAPDANLICSPCGGQGEGTCYGICDPGYTTDPNALFICTACGGDGEPTCLDLDLNSAFCDPWNQPNIGNLLYCAACGGDGQLPCEAYNPWVTNCKGGLEVFLNGTCEPCGVSFGPTCSPGPACHPRHNVGTDLVDVFGVGVTAAIEALDFLDVIPGVCLPCGGIGDFLCEEEPGCTDFPYAREFLGFCQFSGFADEPETCGDDKTSGHIPGADDPVWGWIDSHEHQFANDAYGGALLWGKPFDPRGVNAALAWCDYTWDFETKIPLLDGPLVGAMTDVLTSLDGRGYPIHGSHTGLVPTQWTFGFIVHQAIGLTDFGALHDVTGVKEDPFDISNTILDPFIGNVHASSPPWPHYTDGAHQQMYYKWLERSFLAGQRVLINLPVNNAVLCRASLTREGYSCNDMESVEPQIAGIKALEKFIDLENDGILNNNGWYRVAYSPVEARAIIEDGAMAVIIGIEVDTLFNCAPGTENTFCTEEYVREQLDILYSKGIRHVYPVHAFDNAFAGADLYSDIFAVANALDTLQPLVPYDCSGEEEGFTFKFTQGMVEEELANWFPALSHTLLSEFLDFSLPAHCNSKGLTTRGGQLLTALMDKRVIIDIDHLSHRALEGHTVGNTHYKGALRIMEEREYPPVSGHTVVHPNGHAPTEFGYTVDQIERIRDMGGLVAVNPARDYHDPMAQWDHGTTETFVFGQYVHKDYIDENLTWQHYDGLGSLGYNDIVELMKKSPDDEYPRIAFIADFGCFIDQPGPRFLDEDGDGELTAKDPEAMAAAEKLDYPYTGFHPGMGAGADRDPALGGLFDRQVTGSREFDFNTAGMAHAGLMPDLLADAADNYGADLRPLFNSAEAFLRLWEDIWRDGPVARWNFDEASGGIANDSAVAKENGSTWENGTIQGATRVEGRCGGALHFDGDEDVVLFGNPTLLRMGNDQSISMWIKPSDFDSIKNLYSKAFAGEGTIVINTDGSLNYQYGTLGSNEYNPDSGYYGYAMTSPVALDEWTHLAVVRDLTHGKIVWYKNGVVTNTYDGEHPLAKISFEPVQIGGGHQDSYKGDLDEVIIYDLALDADQVFELFDEECEANSIDTDPDTGASDSDIFVGIDSDTEDDTDEDTTVEADTESDSDSQIEDDAGDDIEDDTDAETDPVIPEDTDDPIDTDSADGDDVATSANCSCNLVGGESQHSLFSLLRTLVAVMWAH